MSVFLGATNKKTPLNLKEGEESFWCVYGSYKAQWGDLILLYKTTYGIAQIYKILSEPYLHGEVQCGMRDMLTVDTVLLAIMDNPIPAAEMKADPTLREWDAVRRNFQQTTFKIGDEEWATLKTLIITKNPGLREVLNTKSVSDLIERVSE